MNGIFTNNWKGLKNRMLLGHKASAIGLDTVYNTSGGLVGASANGYSWAYSPLNDIQGNRSSSGYYSQNLVRFGTSDTAPTAADLNLGDPWSSGLSYIAVNNGAAVIDGNTVSRSHSVTVQNTAAAAVTVREFGLFVYMIADRGNGTGDVMLYREVLETPVTIAQYESATLTFTVTMTLSDPN